MGRAVLFLGGVAWRSFRKAPLITLFVAVLVLAVVQGWFEPYDPPMCEQHPSYEACR